MFTWSLVLAGPILLPLALILRTDLPALAAEGLLISGVVTMFLAICAGEALGAGRAPRRAAASDEA